MCILSRLFGRAFCRLKNISVSIYLIGNVIVYLHSIYAIIVRIRILSETKLGSKKPRREIDSKEVNFIVILYILYREHDIVIL